MARVSGIGLGAALGLVILVTGCATPLQQCIITANQDVIEIQRELDERRNNLRRGYRIERYMAPELVPSLCPGPGGAPVPCMRWEQEVQELHRPINADLERERIALLERQLERAGPQAARAEAQCRATYPES